MSEKRSSAPWWQRWRRRGDDQVDPVMQRFDELERAVKRIALEQTKANMANEALHDAWDRLAQQVSKSLRSVDEQSQRMSTVTLRLLEETRQQAQSDVMDEMVPHLFAIADALFQAEKAAHRIHLQDEAMQGWTQGLTAIRARAEEALANWNIVPTSMPGTLFNPEVHEAVDAINRGAGVPVIHEELRRGYKCGNRLLRTAKVVVRYDEQHHRD